MVMLVHRAQTPGFQPARELTTQNQCPGENHPVRPTEKSDESQDQAGVVSDGEGRALYVTRAKRNEQMRHDDDRSLNRCPW